MKSFLYEDTQTVVFSSSSRSRTHFLPRLHWTLQHHVPFYYFMLAWITPCTLQEPFLEQFHLSSLKANIHHTQEKGNCRWPTSPSKPPSITQVLASPSIFSSHCFFFPSAALSHSFSILSYSFWWVCFPCFYEWRRGVRKINPGCLLPFINS